MEPDSKHDEFNPSTTPHVPAHDHRAERCPPPRRRRRRGPRSIEALERRSRLRLTPPSVARGEARAVSPDTAGGVPFVPMSSSTSSTTPCPHLLQLLLRRRALLQVLPAKPLHPPWLTMLLAIFVLLLLLHRLLFFRVVYIIRVATAILLTETVFSNMCEFGVSMFESSFDGRPSSRLA